MDYEYTDEDQKRKERILKRKAIRKRRLRIRRIQFGIGLLIIASIIVGGSIVVISKVFPENKEINKAVGVFNDLNVFAAVDPSKVSMPDWIEDRIIEENPYSRPGTPLNKINGIVIHYVANPGTTAEENNRFFAGLANQQGTKATSASSHFLIGIDGTIIQNVPITEVAYCSNGRNDDTISIECCHPDETGEFTEETYESLVKLTAWLTKELNIKKEDIIRHYDVTGKICPKYFVDHEDAWLDFKKEVMAASKEK